MRRLEYLSVLIVIGLRALPGGCDVSQLHREMYGIPDDVCLRCHHVVAEATGPRAIPRNAAHGVHLHVVENCSDCHASVDLAKAAAEPWESQVQPEVCYQCHQGETTMVRQVLEAAASAKGISREVLETLDGRAPLPSDGDFRGSETCGDCHEELYEFWKKGPHARAMTSPVFQQNREFDQHAQACLRCHTTGFNAETGQFAEEGVGCEVCHGPYVKDHPDTPQGEPGISSPICANCHLDEWGEWRSSRHAEASIQCDKCHDPHGQHILFPTVQELCSACHEERGEVFAHSTHAERELLCSECHMHPAEHGGKTGHTFSVGSGTCIRCHRDEIHAREKIVALGAEVHELREMDETSLREDLSKKQTKIDQLKASGTLRLYTGLLQGSLIGLAVGGIGAWTAARRWREDEENEDEVDKDEDSSSADQA